MNRLLFISLLLLACSATAHLPTPEPVTARIACHETVLAEHLNLRMDPDTMAPVKTVLDKGQPVTVMLFQGGWSWISATVDGEFWWGWSKSNFISECP